MPPAWVWLRLCRRLLLVSPASSGDIPIDRLDLVGLVLLLLLVAAASRGLWSAVAITVGAQAALRRAVRLGELERVATTARTQHLRMVPDAACFAWVGGLLRPQMVVSTGLWVYLSADERRALVEHEAEHVARRDTLRLLLARVARSALFILPIAKDLEWRVRAGCELRADSKVSDREALAAAILKLAKLRIATAHEALSGAASELELRLAAILEPDRVRRRLRMSTTRLVASTAMLASLALLGGQFVGAHPMPPASRGKVCVL